MKNKSLLLIIAVSLLLISCIHIFSFKQKNYASTTEISTKSEHANDKSWTQDKEKMAACKVVEEAVEDLKKLDANSLSKKMVEKDRNAFTKYFLSLIDSIPQQFQSISKDLLSKLKMEITDCTKDNKNQMHVKVNFVMGKGGFIASMVLKKVPNELPLEIVLIKENGEYKISNINTIISNVYSKVK